MRRIFALLFTVLALSTVFVLSLKAFPVPSKESLPSKPLTSLTLSSGHILHFFAPLNGPVAIGELGRIGTLPHLNEKTLAGKKVSEIYTMFSGAAPPAALVEAENRTRQQARFAPPPQKSAAVGRPTHTTSEQKWFQSTFCTSPIQECILGYFWANGAYGHHKGRGFVGTVMNGSEAKVARTVATDYWNGSSWATIWSAPVPPGYYQSFWAGNTGLPNCANSTWYFRSEIMDNGVGDNATVGLTDLVYSPGGGFVRRVNCYEGNNCSGCCNCQSCPVGRGGSNGYNVTCNYQPLCLNNSCVNPP